jgi:glutamate 5-kinase
MRTEKTPLVLQVLKVGTSSLYNQELSCVNINNLSRITEAVKQLHRMGASRVRGRV